MSTEMDSKTGTLIRATNLLAGMQKHYPDPTQTMFFGGVTRTVSAVMQIAQSYVDLRQAVLTAQAAAKAKLETERSQAPALLADLADLGAFLRVSYGNQPDVLADFGLAPRKARASLTAVQKAAAAAKSTATRAARHTMGKAQKKAVKGNVTGVVVTPVTAPSAAPAPAKAT